MLLAVLALLEPKVKELALLAVEAPKRLPPPELVPLEPIPNGAWLKEKPPESLTGWPKPLTVPNTDLPNPVANPEEVNAVGAVAVEGTEAADEGTEEGTEGAEGGKVGFDKGVVVAGCPKIEPAAVVVVVLPAVGVGVVAAVAIVLIAAETPIVVLSVVAGRGAVNIEPGVSEADVCGGVGSASETGAASEVGTAAAASASGTGSGEI